MKHKILRIVFSSFFVLNGLAAFAQSDVVPAGGTATGEGGTVTFSVGQIAVQSNEEGSNLFSRKIEGEIAEIPMSDFATGTYFVNVLDGTCVLKSFKVVKMAQ